MRFAITIACIAVLAGCASAPSWPDPQPDSGQILVHLDGKARQGVRTANNREIVGEYDSAKENTERGANFERVNYGAIEDVVVILHGTRQTSARGPGVRPILAVGNMKFSRQQVAMLPGGTLTLRNDRSSAVTVFGASDDEFFELTVEPKTTGSVTVPRAGVYEVMCEEDESLSCTLYVTEGICWIGPSSESAFFIDVEPGKYTVSVYAPRLPARSFDVTVEAGTRHTATINLSVNDLPKMKR
ncbi:MAG: hypothetical protein KF696_14820 [Planctomycetes bacterium]|nr:hypothetical protein [Planctomycetota bacterium]MCW8137109.1 hypothetical protein [Planctomycetota bacterium]